MKAFLACALALRPFAHHHSAREFLAEYLVIHEIFNKVYPGCKVKAIDAHIHLVPKGYQLSPFKFHHYSIYFKKAA